MSAERALIICQLATRLQQDRRDGPVSDVELGFRISEARQLYRLLVELDDACPAGASAGTPDTEGT